MPTQEECQEFAEYIQNMRESVNWKMTQLGRALDVTDKTIKNWENGESLKFRRLDELAANIRLVIQNEQSRLRKVEEINKQFENKYTFKGGKLVSG